MHNADLVSDRKIPIIKWKDQTKLSKEEQLKVRYLRQDQIDDGWDVMSWKELIKAILEGGTISKQYVYWDVNFLENIHYKAIYLKNCIIESGLYIENWTFESITLEGCIVKSFIIKWWTFNNKLVIRWGIFTYFQSNISLEISAGEFKEWILLDNPIFNDTTISWWTIKDGFYVRWWTYNKFLLNLDWHMDKLNFHPDAVKFVSLQWNMLADPWEYIISWANFLEMFEIKDLTNTWLLHISDIRISEKWKFIIWNSILSNAEFKNLSLDKAEVAFDDSDISEVRLINVTLPSEIWVFWTWKQEDQYKRLMETYKQLKWIYLRQKDNKTAFYFENKEKDIYYRNLWLHKSVLETVVLFFHRYSNNFWQNWILPIVWLFALGIMFFFFFEIETNFFDKKMIFDYWYNFWYNYLLFIYPLHSFWPEYYSIFDMIFRLISTYFLFQAWVAIKNNSL